MLLTLNIQHRENNPMHPARNARGSFASKYQRHQPELTLLYSIIEQHYLGSQGRALPGYVQQEFDDFLQCGHLEYCFLRVRFEYCKHKRPTVDGPTGF
jgi:hypothetical protein